MCGEADKPVQGESAFFSSGEGAACSPLKKKSGAGNENAGSRIRR